MKLELHPTTERWISEQVASGRFATPEEAVDTAVADFAATGQEVELDAEDIAAIAEADAEVERGEVVDFDAFRAEFEKRFPKQP
jgi:Arc/MetJ-type ribon-helix-helix transcriptional regulator